MAAPVGRWETEPSRATMPAASTAKPAQAASRTPKAAAAGSRAKPQPTCRFAHLNAVRPGDLAVAVRAVRDYSQDAAPSRATVQGFSSSKRAAAFVLAAAQKAGAAQPSGSTPKGKAAFILAAAAKARPNRNGA